MSSWSGNVLEETAHQPDHSARPVAIARWDYRLRPLIGVIALACAGIVLIAEWAPILTGGLWLDETFTFWQSYRGWQNALAVASHTAGVSPLFAAVSSLFYFGPGKRMEFWLRLPDFLAMLLAAYFVFKLAGAWFGKNAGWLALVMFVSEKDIISRATEARPYGLALASCLGLMYGLHVWLSGRRAWGWVLFVICAILLPYWHILFLPFFLVPALYVGVLRRQGRRVPWLWLALSAALILLAWIPLKSQFFALRAAGHSLSFAAYPTFDTFMEVLLPKRFVIAGFLAVMAAQFLWKDSFAAVPRVPGGRLLLRAHPLALVSLAWMFCGPVALFAGSKLKGYGMLVERYAIYSVAGMVLLAAQFFAGLRTSMAQATALAIFALVSLAGAASHHWHGPSMGSWREPVRQIAAIDPAGEIPVLVSSGFVESNAMDWEHPNGWTTHLYAPLLVYPIRNHWYPLPYRLDKHAQEYADRLLDGPLRGKTRIMLLAAQPSDLTAWIAWKLQESHYRMRSESPDSVVLMVFDAASDLHSANGN